MLRTMSIPTDLAPSRFLPLMKTCSQIFNEHVKWSMENKTYNKGRAHKSLYADLRSRYPEVPSALIQSVRDTAMEAVRAQKFKRAPRKSEYGALRYDARTMSLRGERLTLSCIGKRGKTILKVPEYFREIFDNWTLKGAAVVWKKRDGRIWVHMVFEADTPRKTDGGVAGIDRGLRHLAVTSDGQFYSGSRIRANQRKYLHNRRTLQAKGTPSARRRLKAMSGREKRFSQDVNHRISKGIAQTPETATFVLEDLSGIRAKRRGKRLNKWLGSWPFYQLQMFLQYKAEKLGKEVAFVDARYTSQRCSRCGHIYKGNRKGGAFRCVRCGYTDHADLNAAKNIRDLYILSTAQENGSVEQAAVNQPYATDFGLVASHQACPGGS